MLSQIHSCSNVVFKMCIISFVPLSVMLLQEGFSCVPVSVMLLQEDFPLFQF